MYTSSRLAIVLSASIPAMRSSEPPRRNMPLKDAVRIRPMIKAAEAVRSFTAGRQRDDLDRDRMLMFALTRAIEILG